jgi:tetratricopeptide (TPR) repeat protein
MSRTLCYMAGWLLALLPLYGLTVEEAFEKGNQAYVRGENALKDARKTSGSDKQFQIDAAEREFKDALGSFQSCLEKAESSALHYNLGNTFFKLGVTGHAIHHFRRAQELDPASEEIRANLAFVRKAAGFPEAQTSLYDKTLGRRPVDFWMWMLSAGFWFGVALLVFPRMYGLGGVVIPIVGCAVLLFSFVPLWAVLQADKFRDQAIVLDADTALLVSPTKDSAAAAFLQAGEAVTIQPTKTQPNHFFVRSNDGEEGWVFSKHLGRIRE